MATAFRFLGAKPDPRRQGQRNGQGEIQTGRLQGILSIQKGVIRAGGGWGGSRWSTGTGCRQKTALCLQVTFDTSPSEALNPAGVLGGGGMAQEGWAA